MDNTHIEQPTYLWNLRWPVFHGRCLSAGKSLSQVDSVRLLGRWWHIEPICWVASFWFLIVNFPRIHIYFIIIPFVTKHTHISSCIYTYIYSTTTTITTTMPISLCYIFIFTYTPFISPSPHPLIFLYRSTHWENKSNISLFFEIISYNCCRSLRMLHSELV